MRRVGYHVYDLVMNFWGRRSGLRVLNPTLLRQFPESVIQLRAFVVIRPIWSHAAAEHQFQKVAIRDVGKGVLVGVQLWAPDNQPWILYKKKGYLRTSYIVMPNA